MGVAESESGFGLSADWWFSEWKTFDLENCNRTINTFYELRVAFCLFVLPFVLGFGAIKSLWLLIYVHNRENWFVQGV